MISRANYYQLNRPAVDHFAAAGKQLASIDAKLRALVELRVSQINGCVYCCDLHCTQARAEGETQQRLDCVAAWYECPFFDDREKAALAWAESLVHVATTHAPDDVYDRLKPHFTETQIVDLTLIISFMNAWNRIAIGLRTLPAPRKA
jgi:AhpD family alkylhydroperoxidase